jgi:hypothetical protein
MKRTSMVLLILFLIIGGYTCGCSNDKPGVESKVKEAVKSLEDNVVGEAEKLEEDYRVLEAEKDYKRALEEEPKAPPEAMEGPGVVGEGLVSPPE